MAAHGKNIQLYLMDGDASGRIKCSLANWTGVAYKIPRIELDKCKDREDLKQSGVYFLFGKSDETEKEVVYIGQAGARKNGEGILNRLMEHKRNPEKDYWTEAVVFTTSNNSLGPTEISYLENRFCNLAIEANRYEVKNGNDPNHGNITEEKESEMEEFIDYAKVIMGTLGHKVFEPVKKPAVQKSDNTANTVSDEIVNLHLERTIKNVGKVEANGSQTSEGFVVFKNSHIATVDDDTIPDVIKERRKNASVDEQGILQEDMLFTSPSYAAMFVIGKSAKATPHNSEDAGAILCWHKIARCTFLNLICRASRIRLPENFCQPESGLPTQTSYSIFEFVFANLGIVFFDTAADLLLWQKRVQLSNVPMILNVRPFWHNIVRFC